MVCVPTESFVVLNVAWCVVALTVPVPMVVDPSLKVTVPLGLPPKAPVTVAVKVTACPLVDGFGEDVSFVVVVALFTVRLTADEVLVLKSVLPP
jgi:hypothetical protein